MTSELFGGAMQLYRASDVLVKHREALEAHLFERAMGLFDLHYSEQRAEKERGIVERFAARFETALTQLDDGLVRPRAHNASARSGSASGD